MSRRMLAYFGLFLFAFALRCSLVAATVGFAAPPKRDANPDQIEYEAFAYHLAYGDGYVLYLGEPTACRSPGTAFVLTPIYAMFGRDYAIARLWFCLLSALCIPLVGTIADRILKPKLGYLAALWLALYPGHAYYAIHFLSETPATLLSALAILLQITALRRHIGWRDLALGLTLGFGVLIRPSFAIIAVVSTLVALGTAAIPRRGRILKAAVVTFAAVLVVAPWLVRNKAVVGEPVLSTIVGGYTYWGANNPQVYDDPHLIGYWIACSSMIDAEHPLEGNELEREAAAWKYGKEYRAAASAKLPEVMLHRFGRVLFAYSESTNRAVDLAFRGGWLLSLPFVLTGMIALLRRVPAEAIVLLGPGVAVLITAATFYGCSRFRDGAAPAWAVFASAGVGVLWDCFRGRTPSDNTLL